MLKQNKRDWTGDSMRIIFLRHGESMGNVWEGAYNNENANFLTIRGVKQAEIAAYEVDHLCKRYGLRIDEVVSSEAIRATQTATTVMQTLGDWKRHYVQDSRLNEWGYGLGPNEFPHGLEPQDDFKAKVNQWYDENIVPNLKSDMTFLVTSHFYTMSAFFERLDLDMGIKAAPVDINSYEEGYTIPNSVPFFYDSFKLEPPVQITPGFFNKRR